LSFDSRKREVGDDSSRSLLSLPIGARLAGEMQPIRFEVPVFDSFARSIFWGSMQVCLEDEAERPGRVALPLPRVSIGLERGIGAGRGRRRGA
jgi:hypothetical protein